MNKQFGYDVCISFHKADNEPEFRFVEGWIAAFHQCLAKLLSQMLGKEPKILLYDQINQTQLKDVETASVLIFVLSENSFNDRVCLHTLHTFNQSSLKNRNTDKLVLKVFKTPVPVEQQPELLRSITKFSLHLAIKESIPKSTIIVEENYSNHQAYWVELVRMATVIQKFLQQQKADTQDNSDVHYQDNQTDRFTDILYNPPQSIRTNEAKPYGFGMTQDEDNYDKPDTEKIYLVYDLPDSQAITPLRNFLHNQGYHVVEPNFKDALNNRRKIHEFNLISAGAIIIFYGNTNKQWLQMKVLDLLKSSGLGRKGPFLGKAIYNTQQNQTIETEAKKYNLTIIEHDKIFPPQSLEDFLKNLKDHDA